MWLSIHWQWVQVPGRIHCDQRCLQMSRSCILDPINDGSPVFQGVAGRSPPHGLIRSYAIPVPRNLAKHCQANYNAPQ
ncbi:hypothetical protein AUK22_07740 [bacterium CG2_30_54_10]|nr:MAG: hypothetical protein AUK22_07740 [bacterium CG2_30_54_10]